MGIVAGILSMFSWGTAIFLAALASRKLGNVLTLFWMQIFGFMVGLVYFLMNFSGLQLSSLSSNLLILIAVAVLQVVAYLTFYKGLEKAQVSLVSPIGAAWGLVAAILGILFFKETLKFTQLIGMVLILMGIILLSFNLKELLKSQKINLFAGVKEGIIAMLGWGISLFLLALASKTLGWFLPAFIFRLFVLLILVSYIFTTNNKFLPKAKTMPWLLLALVGLFDIGGFFAYSFGTNNVQSSVVAPIGSAFALITVIYAKLFLKEKLDRNKILGILTIVGGLVLMSV